MPLSESPEKQAIRELGSKVCFCGKEKFPRRSFCASCYFDLPANLRADLYKTFSEGYAEVYSEAKDYLKIEKGKGK